MKTYDVTVTVMTRDDLAREEVVHLIKLLLDTGMEDAVVSEKVARDFDDPDREDAASLDYTVS